MLAEPADGAALWSAVGRFSDAQLERTKRSVRQFHAADEAELATPQAAAVELHLSGEKARVRVDDFVHVLVDHLHALVQSHEDTQDNHVEDNQVDAQEDEPFELHKEEFPQLGGGSTKPQKRRITTTLVTKQDTTRPVPAAVEFPPLEGGKTSAWAKQSLLERRMGATPAPSAWGPKPDNGVWGNQKTTVMQVKTKSGGAWGKQPPWGNQKAASPEMHEKKPVAMHVTPRRKATAQPQQMLMNKKPSSSRPLLKSNEGRSSNQEPEEPAVDKPASNQAEHQSGPTAADFHVNRQAAKLYGFLIKERFVASTSAELQVLIGLLYRRDCSKSCAVKPEQNASGDSASKANCAGSSEFCWRVHCLEFAEIALLEIEDVVTSLGSNLLGLVTQSLRAKNVCTDMLARLEQTAQRREELRLAESARVGCELPVEMKASGDRDFALPFCEETDSRLHYHLPAESSLFNNREKVRDGFLKCLRQFQHQQHSLAGIENADAAAKAIASAKKLLADVTPENRWWFAKFFVLELIQVGSNPFGENDQDVVKLTEKNPGVLLKLAKRMTTQKPPSKSPQPPSRSGGNTRHSRSGNNRTAGQEHGNPHRKHVANDAKQVDATRSFTETFSRMRRYFTDNQLFFFHFLHSCDSYEFSELVKHQLERQFYAILQTPSAANDTRKTFTETVLKLKVVAKFIGYLRFSPQWQVTSSIRQLSEHNAAFKAVEREGIRTLEVARDASLDVKKLLEDSILQSSITKCIPWLCDYLSMLSFDKLSSGTTYFKQVVVLLQLLYRSSRLDALGEAGLYIALQIERIFHMLHLDTGFARSSEFQSRSLLPSPQVRLSLVEATPDTPAPHGEDHLRFLYNEVFIQSCVSELDDLRSYIQRRAQHLHAIRRTGSSSKLAVNQPITPIRKLRPLQVVVEDDHTGIPIHPAAMETAFTESFGSLPRAREERKEGDKLAEALFKVHPNLKPVVEFVVGNVTTAVCEFVMTHVVKLRADKLVDACASASGLASAAPTKDADVIAVARASFSMMISSKTRPEVNATSVAAVQEALGLAQERISKAIPPFMPPSSHPTLTHSVVSVALQQARGSIQALVPKSVQREFVKRIAFRNKSLLKGSNSASKVSAAVLPPGRAVANGVGNASVSPSTPEPSAIQDASLQEEQRYLSLKECVAGLSKHSSHAGLDKQGISKWKLQATAMTRSLTQFSTEFAQCDAAGDLACHSLSALSVSGLVVWDVAWRAVTSCLKFYGLSLESFAVGSLDTTEIDEHFVAFVASFASSLRVLVCSIRDQCDAVDTASRLQSLVAFVLDYVMAAPPATCRQLAIKGSSTVLAELRASANDGEHLKMNWDLWKSSPKDADTAQFRLDVWSAGEQ